MAQKTFKFKVSLDETKLVSGLKTIQRQLESMSEASKKGKATHAQLQAGLDAAADHLGALTKNVGNYNAKMTAGKNILQSFKQSLNSTIQGTQKMAQTFQLLRNVMSQGIDSIRQITQGFLSMGRALTFFIAIPFTAWLKESISYATDFEAAMARVSKVAGFDSDAFGNIDIKGPQSSELNTFIRDFSEVAGTDQLQLAQWAEDLAQFGLKSVAALKDYLPMMEMISQGTDVAASSVASSIGKIASSFGYYLTDTTGQTEDFVWRLMNVINQLENNVGATAQEIMTAVEAAGPTLSQLGVPAYIVASWSALGVEAGLSAEEVGTGLRNLGSFVARNYQKAFDESHTLLKEMFGSASEMANAFSEDFAGTFMNIIDTYKKSGNALVAIGELYDFLGMRAGKFAATLVKASGESDDAASRLLETISKIEEQWKNPTSLATEYQAVTKTLAHNTQMLKNAINNLSLSVGDSLIPELVKLVQSAIPAVRALASLFAGLPEGTKRIIFLASAIVAISGPFLFFFSQMAFGASLVISGLIKLGGVFGTVGKIMGVFAMQLIRLNPIAWLFAGVVSRAFNLISGAATKMASRVSGTLAELANAMPNWGENIFDALATGIESSASRIARAVSTIAQIIARFFEAHSPPKEGPLQHIDKWGKTLFDTYLAGFKDADFSVLKDIGNTVQGLLQNWMAIGKIDEDGTAQYILLQFRQDLAELISQFNDVGSVSDSAIRQITNRFGEASDEIFKLIKLNLQLKGIIEDIEGVEKRKTEVTQAYRDQVRDLMKSNMSLEDQAALLGQLQQERDKDLAILDEEQERLENRKDSAQDELDLQEELLGAYQDQDDIYADMLQAIEDYLDKLSGGIGDLSEALSNTSLDMSLDGLEEAQSAMDAFGKSMATLQGNALKIETTVRGIFTAIGLMFKEGAVGDLSESLLGNEDLQQRVADYAKTAIRGLSGLANDTDDYADVVQGLADIFGKDFLIQFFSNRRIPAYLDSTGEKAEILRKVLEEMDDEDLTGLVDALKDTDDSAGDLFGTMTELGGGIEELFLAVEEVVEPAYKKLHAFLLALSGQEIGSDILNIDGNQIEGIDKVVELGTEIGELWTVLQEKVPVIVSLIGEIGESLLNGLGINVSGDISGDVSDILDKLIGFLESVASINHPVAWLIGATVGINILKANIGTIASGLASSLLGKLLIPALSAIGGTLAPLAPVLVPLAIATILTVSLDEIIFEGGLGISEALQEIIGDMIAGTIGGMNPFTKSGTPGTGSITWEGVQYDYTKHAGTRVWDTISPPQEYFDWLSGKSRDAVSTGVSEGIADGVTTGVSESIASTLSQSVGFNKVDLIAQFGLDAVSVSEAISQGVSEVDFSALDAQELATSLETANTYMETILTQMGSEAWANFKADVGLLGGEGDGSLAGAFSAGQTAAEALMTFLNTDFTNALNAVVAVFTRLMTGHWDINVTVDYLGTTGNQTGGPVIPSQLSTVGETGTELFSPPTRGHITSHSELSSILSQANRAGGSSGNEYNIQVTGSPVAMTEDELLRTLRRVEFLHG